MRLYTVFRIHKYSGLGAGLILGLLALTGFFLDHENFDFLWDITIDDRLLPESIVAKKSRAIEAYRVDTSDPQHIMVGSRRGFYLSSDGGRSFERTLPAQVLAIDAYREQQTEDFQYLFAATTMGLQQSRDGGQTWELLALENQPVTSLTVFGGAVHAVVDKRTVYRIAPDNGATTMLSITPVAANLLPHSLTLNRLVRDLHYGRGLFSGDSSLLINDYLAIILLFLSVGGFVIYFMVRRIRRHRKPKPPSMKFWLTTHAHGIGLLSFLPLLLILVVTGVFLDHSGAFRSFLKSTTVDTGFLPPVYRDLSTDIWGFDFDGEHYRLGNRLGIFSSTDLEHWTLEKKGFAWRMKRLGDRLLVAGMGAPNLILQDDKWKKLESSPHMPRDFFIIDNRLNYLSMHGETPPLPQWKSTSLYHIMLGLHDGELAWGQWVWLNDLAAVAALLLFITGLIKWLHRKKKRKNFSKRKNQ